MASRNTRAFAPVHPHPFTPDLPLAELARACGLLLVRPSRSHL